MFSKKFGGVILAKKERIDKILGNLGYGTRKELKKLAKSGVITVNGEVIKDSSTKADPENDEITFMDEIVNYRKYVYLMLNKPAGYISATEDYLHDTVLELIDEEYLVFNLFPAGRLDKDTEGLLLLTNDGQFAHRILAPKNKVPKTYYAEVAGIVDEHDIEDFSEGLVLDDGYETLPAELKILEIDESNSRSQIELTIVEGKFHQVKRMFEAVGKSVVYLKRLSMGNLKLDDALELGEYREITEEELENMI